MQDRMFRRTKAQALLLVFLFLASLLAVQFAFAQTSTPAPRPAPTPKMLWQFTPYNYPGPGKFSISQWSTPTVVDGVVYVDMMGSRNYDKTVPIEGLPGTTHSVNVDESWGGVYAINATTGKLRWFFTSQGTELSPAVGDARVFAPISPYLISAFNISNGRNLWNHTLAFPISEWGYYNPGAVGISSSPSYSDGRVFFGLTDSNVIALNASTGKTLWTFATAPLYQLTKTTSNDNPVRSTPTAANGVVYVDSTEGHLYALNASSGKKLWSYSFGGGASDDSIPVVAGSSIFFSTSNGEILSLNVADGSKIWNYSCGSEWISTPNYDTSYVFVSPLAIEDNAVFFNYDAVVGWKDSSYKYFGVVCTLNALSGTKMWNKTISIDTPYARTAHNGVVVHNGVVYAFSDDQNLYALNARNGETFWNYNIGKFVVSSKIENGVAYFSPEKDILYALQLLSEPTPSPNPTSTIPEFSWITILTLSVSMLAAVAVAIVVVAGLLVYNKRKTKR
jgi:outer membrane protein assembly factor BamB